MRILICGAGALGSVFGGFLAKAGHEVTLLGRPWHLDVIRRDGLRLSGLWGEHVVRGCALADSPEALRQAPAFDWALCCVKAHQTAEAAQLLAVHLGPATLVCALQNGLGNDEALTASLPPERVALGRVIFGAEISPGHVRISVCADDVLIGSPGGRVDPGRVAALVGAIKAAGIPCRETKDIVCALWAKVLYNCALNGLSTLLEVPYGRLLEHQAARRLMACVIREAYRVAAAHRITLEPAQACAYEQQLFTRLIPDTAAHHSSMLQDLQRGKRTEIDALNGAIVRLAEQAGIQAPANALITRLVHTKEAYLKGSNRGNTG